MTESAQTTPPRSETIREYLDYFDQGRGAESRKADYARMINQYYDLVTDFYEYGWGDSFHFAPRFHGESFEASLRRHQHYLALRLGLRRGITALDIGCGVGGPMRSIARFSGATIHGVNNNDYQISKGHKYNRQAGLQDQLAFYKADFMDLPFEPTSYDAAYAIEATCHAPDKAQCFAQVFRVLKPGALFAVYEWCLTDKYDPNDPRHREIKHGIEAGDGLPDLGTIPETDEAVRKAGFELLEGRDLALTSDRKTPWYLPLKGEGFGLTTIRHNPLGRRLVSHAVAAVEKLGIVPQGSAEVSKMLNAGADALVRGGKTGIFTPSYFILARKPGPLAN